MLVASYIYIGQFAPKDTTQLWVEPKGGGDVSLHVFSDGGWKVVGGGDGKSAYELAVEKGYSGTLDEWLDSLQGKSFTYDDLTSAQKAELAQDAVAAANRAAQAVETIEAAISDLDPSQSAEDAVVALAARQGVLENNIDALGPKIDKTNLSIKEAVIKTASVDSSSPSWSSDRLIMSNATYDCGDGEYILVDNATSGRLIWGLGTSDGVKYIYINAGGKEKLYNNKYGSTTISTYSIYFNSSLTGVAGTVTVSKGMDGNIADTLSSLNSSVSNNTQSISKNASDIEVLTKEVNGQRLIKRVSVNSSTSSNWDSDRIISSNVPYTFTQSALRIVNSANKNLYTSYTTSDGVKGYTVNAGESVDILPNKFGDGVTITAYNVYFTAGTTDVLGNVELYEYNKDNINAKLLSVDKIFDPESISSSSFFSGDCTRRELPETLDVTLQNPTYIEVASASELDDAISTNGDIVVTLTQDIAIQHVLSLNGRNAVINGNGNRLFYYDGQYTGGELSGNMRKVSYSGTLDGTNVFIANNGDVLKLSESTPFVADSNVILVSLDAGETNKGAYKLKLPDEISDISILETDNVFIAFFSSFITHYAKVTGVSDGYIHFQYGCKAYSPDWENTIYSRHTTFRLINYYDDQSCCKVRNGYLYYPCVYDGVSEPSDSFLVVRNADVMLTGLRVYGSATRVLGLIDIDSTAKLKVQECEFHHSAQSVWNGDGGYQGHSSVIYNLGGNLYINKCRFSDIGANGIFCSRGSNLVCVNSSFSNCCNRRTNSSCITARCRFYVANNEFYNYGYKVFAGGDLYVETDGINTGGVIEYNLLKQDADYFNKAVFNVPSDGGALGLGCYVKDCIIRYNTIVNYNSRYGGHGIYIDEGCPNVVIYGNIVNNTPSGWSISCRYVSTAGSHYASGVSAVPNVNRLICHNVIDGYILFGGATNNNDCFLGHNIKVGMLRQRNVQDFMLNGDCQSEEQYQSGLSLIQDGIPVLSVDISAWRESNSIY